MDLTRANVMRRFLMGLGLCAIVACRHGGLSPAADALPDSAFVLPGAFSEHTTVADLQARFGAPNVKLADVPDAFSGTRPGVVLFPDDPTRRAYVRFYEQEPLHHLASVTVNDAGSRWSGKLGVKIGTSFADLRQRNGAEFWFIGFDAEHEASVRDAWNAGALDVTEGDQLYFGVDLRLREPVKDISATVYPSSEESISSEDPRYPQLGELAFVSAITAWSSLDDEW